MSKRNSKSSIAAKKPWFIQTPGSVLTCTAVSIGSRATYMMYARRDANDDGRVWCEDREIANDLGKSLRQTRRYISELVEAGFITRSGDGVRRVTTLTPPRKTPWSYVPWCVLLDRDITLTGVVLYGLTRLYSREPNNDRIYDGGIVKLARGLLPRKTGGKRDGERLVSNHMRGLLCRGVLRQVRRYEQNALITVTREEDLHRLYDSDGIRPRIEDTIEGERITIVEITANARTK